MINPYGDAIEALVMLAGDLRRRSKYKRYSAGMRKAYTNRAAGIEKAIKVLERLAVDARIEDLEE